MLSSRTVVIGALFLGTASTARAQAVVGPSKCTACHDHDRQTTKWQKEEPVQYKDKAHYNTRKQLDGAKAGTYAKAIGLADPYDVKGSCVTCHATVFRGDANAGVSCESCHGPASGYLEPHQVKGSYAKAVSTGLRDLKGKPPAIAKACVACHLTTDKRLIAAGHPSGAEFDVGAGLKKVVHWATTYDFAAVSAAGKAAMGPGAARAAAAPPPPPAGGAPAAPGGAPPAVKAGGRAPVGGAAAPAAPTAASAPWDWNAPIRALPEDYVPQSAEAAAPAAGGPAGTAAAPAGGTAAPAAPRPARPAPVRVAPAPSLAEDLPVAPAIVATDAAALAPPPPAAAPAGPRSATARVAEARGGAATVLARVLRGGAKVPALPPASPPREFKGPDGELLRLQDEAIALALEALRRP
jgi:hypothetical protein